MPTKLSVPVSSWSHSPSCSSVRPVPGHLWGGRHVVQTAPSHQFAMLSWFLATADSSLLQIACALAAQGKALADVASQAAAAATCLGSCGVAATVCTVPGGHPSSRHVRLGGPHNNACSGPRGRRGGLFMYRWLGLLQFARFRPASSSHVSLEYALH